MDNETLTECGPHGTHVQRIIYDRSVETEALRSLVFKH